MQIKGMNLAKALDSYRGRPLYTEFDGFRHLDNGPRLRAVAQQLFWPVMNNPTETNDTYKHPGWVLSQR